MAKSWTEKYHTTSEPVVKVLDKKFSDIPEGDTMLIATPKLVDEYIREIPEGHQVDIKTIRKDLAIAHQADNTCPVTTGIFLRIVAEKAYEEREKGSAEEEITPFWRAIKMKSPLAKKLSFGSEFLAQQRGKEGLEG